MAKEPTAADGIPSIRINRRNFFVPSSLSDVPRDLEDDFGSFKILLKVWAVAVADGEDSADMRVPEKEMFTSAYLRTEKTEKKRKNGERHAQERR